MKKMLLIFCLGVTLLNGCYKNVEYKTIKESFFKPKVKKEFALSAIGSVLTDKGFDLKMSDSNIGFISTEWKKIYSGSYTGESAPFDSYMQIKCKVLEVNGAIKVKVLPLVKISNRLNPNAFTERFLVNDDKIYKWAKKSPLSPENVFVTEANIYKDFLNDLSKILSVQEESITHINDDSPVTGAQMENIEPQNFKLPGFFN